MSKIRAAILYSIFSYLKNKKTPTNPSTPALCTPMYVSLEFLITIQKHRKKPWQLNSLCSVQFIQLHGDTVQT